jgi:hypothetical protein
MQLLVGRPAILAESQTALKLSFNRPDWDFAQPRLSRFVIFFFVKGAVIVGADDSAANVGQL